MKKFVVTAALVALVSGCAGPNPYRAPVEERGQTQSRQPQPGTVVPAESAPGVKVQSVERVPVIRQQREAREEAQPAPQAAAPVPAQPQSPAVVALLETARQDSSSGDLRTAQSRLERALRIAPRDPEVYIQLADVQRRQGQFLQAEQVALKGVSVAAGQAPVLKRLWRLIADIRQEGGNSQGAQEARRKAESY
ncbi:tetratricopeptide repeat protein [Marinobacterium sp. AK62]|uniref:Tetratricopeptide repeat protein n=1 Tax=Marinobacterium alkalitolerans TaxID=1542925 RepID=A0ABS3ZDG0_9GAMM|nr:tetratricopeptide repeat protein [Marinobacterium alkalitolerans]MBP0049743.1 tetratricopeptide repeat protein [Marinobacterium alkalitolerans]